MTEKQRRFADYFIETGNAAEAARRAGYSTRSAKQIGEKNMTKHDVSAYIKKRLAELAAGRIADAQEVLEVFSGILRGTVADQDGAPASVRDRIEAGKAILRRFERLEDRQTGADILMQARAILGTIESVIN